MEYSSERLSLLKSFITIAIEFFSFIFHLSECYLHRDQLKNYTLQKELNWMEINKSEKRNWKIEWMKKNESGKKKEWK